MLCPSCADICSKMMRGTTSTALPGPNGMTAWIDFVGQVCAEALAMKPATRAVAARSMRRTMKSSVGSEDHQARAMPVRADGARSDPRDAGVGDHLGPFLDV